MTAPTLAALWLHRVVETAAKTSAQADELWELARCSPDDPRDRRLSQTDHLAVWGRAMELAQDDAFPFDVVRRIPLDDYALLGLACKTAPDVAAALDRIHRYLCVFTDAVELRVRYGDDDDDDDDATVDVQLLRSAATHAGGRAANESGVAELLQGMRAVAAGPIKLHAACFRHAAPASTAAHREFFEADVEFDAPFDGLRVARSALTLPLRLADDGLSRFLEQELRAQAAVFDDDRALGPRARAVISDALPAGVPSLQQTARHLGLSDRTLQRRLRQEGLRYRELVDDVRRELAGSFVQSGERTFSEIAFLLGFSEPSAFHRAFKRWEGTTPAVVRAERARKA